MGQGIWTIEPLPASTPVGAISMYAWNDADGLSELNGMGWFLCDGGANATDAGHSLAGKVPDMQNRFVKGGVLGHNIGIEGGSTQTDGTAILNNQMPIHKHSASSSQGSHSHKLATIHKAKELKASQFNISEGAPSSWVAHTFDAGGKESTSSSSSGGITTTTETKGNDEAHTHTYDPYHITVAYIIYLGKVTA